MKIVCLVKSKPPLIYFVNRINERHKVSLVIVESPSPEKKLIKKITSKGILSIFWSLRNNAHKIVKKKRFIHEYNSFFHDKWQSINKNTPTLNVKDINSEITYNALKKEQPDLILDHGTSIVKDRILETSKLALNLHWGLSPYYRGSACTEWALINWDPFNIGVTIHKLTRILDGGDILAQKRAIIKPGDTLNAINMQLTHLGTELIIKAIDKIKSGEKLQFKTQNHSLGFLTLNRQWSQYIGKQIEHVEKNKLIELMLQNPARKQKLPIVEL
jgi:methionyl-tRNA formyltransferase